MNTTVLPATSAGIIFQHGIAIGKFQGVTIPAIPSGWRILIAHLSGSSDGTVSPNIRRPSPAMRNAMSMPSWTSPRASARTLPISRVIARASRSLCWAMSAPKRYRISPRFGAGVAFQRGARHLGGADRHRDVRGGAGLEPPDDLAGVGGVDALERLAGHAVHPATGDEQLVRGRLGGDLGHRAAPRACGGGRLRPYSGHAPGRQTGRRALDAMPEPVVPSPLTMIEPAATAEAPLADVPDAMREAARRVLAATGATSSSSRGRSAWLDRHDATGARGSCRRAAASASAGSRRASTRNSRPAEPRATGRP